MKGNNVLLIDGISLELVFFKLEKFLKFKRF